MDTGSKREGNAAPERYVSETAFEELPEVFQKLAGLLGEDQFELVPAEEVPGKLSYVKMERSVLCIL